MSSRFAGLRYNSFLSEIRIDPASGHAVIVQPGRARRPSDFSGKGNGICPFCPGNEHETPPEVLAVRDSGAPNTPGWRVRIVPNKYPAVEPPAGAHDVIIESPDHDFRLAAAAPEQVGDIFRALQQRIRTVSAIPGVRAVSVFKNHGRRAGATRLHPHMQLLTLDRPPARVVAEMRAGEERFRETGRCLWCELADDRERLVFETGEYIVLSPFAARFPFETWVLPKRHGSHFEHAAEDGIAGLGTALPDLMRRLDAIAGHLAYNLVLMSAPVSEQPSPSYHWRLELIPRRGTLGGFELGTGCYINSVPLEEAARRLRETEPAES